MFRLSFLSLLSLFVVSAAFGQKQANLISGKYSETILKQIIMSKEDWHPYPTASEHEQWQQLPEKIKTAHIRQAEKHFHCDWVTPKASVFLEFSRTGNRSRYQNISFGRRQKLAELVIGECIEGKGRFLDDIVNGIWTICEETYWGIPAHLSLQKRKFGLPDVKEPTVDLFAAETGMLMAWTVYLVGDELDKISPLIRERIVYEVERRIISVNLARDDFWWMGFHGQTVNNWNPWICSNWLTAVLLIENDPDRRVKSIRKIMRSLDNFLNPYPADGGCDEGPSYWMRAGGSLYDCLQLLYSVSGGKIDLFDQPLIREMGKYIYRVHINDLYFINFADASAKLKANANLIYRYGKSIRDEKMMEFGAFLAQKEHFGNRYVRGNFGVLGRVLPALFTMKRLLQVPAKAPLLLDVWLPDLQVMSARSFSGSKKGLYLAAKGGNNAESHNHNDVGNFIVYADGYPAIIDVGVETYTKKTFSAHRYEIWTMQSAYHNLPTVNGIMQKNGKEFKASAVQYSADDKKAVFRLDLARAYPAEAKLKTWRRTITLNRGKNVTIYDRYELEEAVKPVQMTLMSSRLPELQKGGIIRLKNPDALQKRSPVFIHFDKNKFNFTMETIPIEDSHLRDSWGRQLFRILLTAKQKTRKDEFTIRIVQK